MITASSPSYSVGEYWDANTTLLDNWSTAAVADAFVRVFVDDVLGPLPEGGVHDPAEWARKRDALERLRPLASDALLAAFKQKMTKAAEHRFAKVLDR